MAWLFLSFPIINGLQSLHNVVVYGTGLTHFYPGETTLHTGSTNYIFFNPACYNICLLMQKTVCVFTLDCPTVQFFGFMWIHLLSAFRPYQSPPAKVASGTGHEFLGVEEKSGMYNRIEIAHVVGMMVTVDVRNSTKLKRVFASLEASLLWQLVFLHCFIFGRKKERKTASPVLVDLKVLWRDD